MRKLIVVVDTQADFMFPVGALYVPGAVGIIVPMIEYLQANADVPVLATMDTHQRETYGETRDAREFGFPPHCLVNSPGWSNVLPLERRKLHTHFIHKGVFSPWEEAVPRALMRGLSTPYDEVEIIGVAADFCVEATYLGYLEHLPGLKSVRVIPELTVGIHRNPFE